MTQPIPPWGRTITTNCRSSRRVIVDLDALVANYKALDAKAGQAICAAVVKANAYGLGAASVAPPLFDAGCRWFFVATANEAFELRAALPDAEIAVFEGPVECEELLRQDILPLLNSYDDARVWAEACSAESPGRCFIHIDSGMNRLGMDSSHLSRLVGNAETLSCLAIEYVATHLACAEESANARNPLQLQRFDELRRDLPPHKTSIASSSGLFLDGDYAGDMVRVGIGMYGANPTPGEANPMQAVVTVQGQILQMRDLESDDAVGYGATAVAKAGARLATVGFGYADGYPRSLGNVAEAMFGSERIPVLGRVSMDNLVVDVSNVSGDVQVGDWVTLVGSEIGLDEVADLAGTISYELLVSIGPRVERIYT